MQELQWAGLGGSGSSTALVMTTVVAALRCGTRSCGLVGLLVLWWLQLLWQWLAGVHGGDLSQRQSLQGWCAVVMLLARMAYAVAV